MERLTEKRDGQNVIPLRQDGKLKWVLCSAGMGNASTQFLNGVYADKLAEYEDLEEQGKLIKLPCNVGDTVFVKMYCGYLAEAEVRDFSYFLTCGFCAVVTSTEFDKRHIPFYEFGKTVFLTKKEAEEEKE